MGRAEVLPITGGARVQLVSTAGKEHLKVTTSRLTAVIIIRVTVGLSMVAGAALGAAAIQTLHAQAKPMGYSIAENVVNDQNGYTKEFIPPITKTIQDAGGKFIVRGGKKIPMTVRRLHHALWWFNRELG
jgi:hypothetical protein